MFNHPYLFGAVKSESLFKKYKSSLILTYRKNVNIIGTSY